MSGLAIRGLDVDQDDVVQIVNLYGVSLPKPIKVTCPVMTLKFHLNCKINCACFSQTEDGLCYCNYRGGNCFIGRRLGSPALPPEIG